MRNVKITKYFASAWDYYLDRQQYYACIPVFGSVLTSRDNHHLKRGEQYAPGICKKLIAFEIKYGIRAFALWKERIITLPLGDPESPNSELIIKSCQQVSEIAAKIKGDIFLDFIGPTEIREIFRDHLDDSFAGIGNIKYQRRITESHRDAPAFRHGEER